MEKKEYFAVINCGDVIIFDNFEKMSNWVQLMATEFYGKNFDLDYFLQMGYSQIYDTIQWTENVAIFED